MKILYAIALAVTALGATAQVTITTTNDLNFTPATVTIQLGEAVQFNVSGIHTATQVSETTWNANGNTMLPGGFHFTAGTHMYTPTEIGTIYFVCQPHSGMGMKGTIVVETNTSVTDHSAVPFRLYPNPANNEINVEGAGVTELVIVDVQGREVLKTMLKMNDRIDVSTLPEGNYTTIIRNEGNVVATQRLSIVR